MGKQKNNFLTVTILMFSVFVFSSCSCSDKKSEESEQDIWVAPEKTDTIAKLPSVDMPDDTVTVKGSLLHFSYLLSPADSLPTVTSYTGQRYYDNSVNLMVKKDGETMFKKHFTKNSFKDCVPSKELKKLSLVGFNYYQAKRDDQSKLYFVAMIGDPDDNDENFYFCEILITDSGNTHIQKAKTEDFFTMPLDYEEE